MNQTIRSRIEQIKRGEIPEGYEKTPFGIFPCDWEKSTLKKLGEFAKGKGIPGEKMKNEGIPCVGYGDIYMKYNYHFNQAKSFIDRTTADESIQVGIDTLLFTGTGETAEEIGKCVCYTGSDDIYVGGDIIIFNSVDVSPVFIAYQQYLPFAIKQKAGFGQGHSVVHIYKSDLEKLYCAYPKSKAEQEKIAEILQEQDRLIELKEKLIEEKKKQKQYLMEVLLTGKVRLPGFTDEWKEGLFGELIDDCNDGATPSRNIAKYFCGRINWIVTDDIKRYIYSSEEKLTEEAVAKTNLKIWQEGTIILSTCATIGVVGILKCKATTKQGITAISLKDKNCNEYVRYWLNLNTKLLNTYAQGSSIREIRVDKLRQIKIRYPSNNEQFAIAEVLSKADDELELLQKNWMSRREKSRL